VIEGKKDKRDSLVGEERVNIGIDGGGERRLSRSSRSRIKTWERKKEPGQGKYMSPALGLKGRVTSAIASPYVRCFGLGGEERVQNQTE